jgi:DUF4097 and DUF4098 domain-containing protein YvlB
MNRTENFHVEGHPRVQVSLRAGDVQVVRGDEGEIEVGIDGAAADGFRVDQIGDLVVVEGGKGRGFRFRSANVTVRVPDGADVEVHVTAGDVTTTAPLGAVQVVTTAGEVRLGAVRSANVRTISGDIRLGRVAGDADLTSTSGDVLVHAVAGVLSVKTASGDVVVEDFRGTRGVGGTMAGDIRLGIPSGRSLRVDLQTLSGTIRNELPFRPGDTSGVVELSLKTLSGDIVLVAA